MNDTLKYTLRKLGFLLVLAALIASPFAVQAYKSATTTDPYILMAREVEAFSSNEIDVINVDDHSGLENTVRVLVITIDDYSKWPERIQENFRRHVMETVREYGYENLHLFLARKFPSKEIVIYQMLTCTNLRVMRAEMCVADTSVMELLLPQYIKWPGIGNP